MSQEPDQFDLPPSLAVSLRGAYRHRTNVSKAVEDAVLLAAREKFARRRRMKLVARWGTGLAAGLAAVIVIAVNLSNTAPVPTPTVATNVRGDVNTDGRVDMVDALALAKRVAGNSAGEKAWDVNGDGKVDNADVDAIAVAAVSLKPRPGVAKAGLPKLDQLGIGSNVGLASASGSPVDNRAMAARSTTVPLAKASPTRPSSEVRQ